MLPKPNGEWSFKRLKRLNEPWSVLFWSLSLSVHETDSLEVHQNLFLDYCPLADGSALLIYSITDAVEADSGSTLLFHGLHSDDLWQRRPVTARLFGDLIVLKDSIVSHLPSGFLPKKTNTIWTREEVCLACIRTINYLRNSHENLVSFCHAMNRIIMLKYSICFS